MKMGFEFTPEQQLVLAMEALQGDVTELKSDVKSHGGKLDGFGTRLERLEVLVDGLVAQIKLYAERRRDADPATFNWHRLQYDIARGAGIAVVTSLTLYATGVFFFGLCMRIGAGGC